MATAVLALLPYETPPCCNADAKLLPGEATLLIGSRLLLLLLPLLPNNRRREPQVEPPVLWPARELLPAAAAALAVSATAMLLLWLLQLTPLAPLCRPSLPALAATAAAAAAALELLLLSRGRLSGAAVIFW
jgi:hypothetical protein